MRDEAFIAAALVAAFGLVSGHALAGDDYGLGRLATPKEIAGWNIDIAPDGTGVPAGRGGVEQGAQIFADKYARHGAHGRGSRWTRWTRSLAVWGTLGTPKPVKTVGSCWPYAPRLFDFVRRAMPFN